MANSLRFDWKFKTSDRGLANLFKVAHGGGGKVKVGVIGPRAAAKKKPSTDKSIDELREASKQIEDKTERKILQQSIRDHVAQRKKDAADSGPTVAEVAAAHELGRGVPKRPFITGWASKNDKAIRQDIAKAIQLVAVGRYTTEQALQILGVKWVAEIQEYMTNSSNFIKNSDETIALKGSSSPLIDTGQLRSSITFKVEKA